MLLEATPAAVEPVDFIDRWRRMGDRRRVQMEAAYARAGIDNADYWGKRAKQYRAALHERTDEDPFFLRVMRDVTPEATVLDVGAGTGRHALALAPHVARVVAVDPSPAMLGLLREDIARAGAGNVETVLAEWLSAEVEPADTVICSHVLYPIADVVPFIRKLEDHARGRVFIYTRVDTLKSDFGLWQEFHGEALQDQPVHMDLLGVLAQTGIQPDVEVVEHRFTFTFASVDEAAAQMRNALCLRADDDGATARLRALLEERLVAWPNGRLGPRLESARSAIIHWAPGSR